MKMQFLGSVALLAFVAPISFAAPPPPAKEIGVNLALRDTAVKPGDDFDGYANGAWRKTTEIPADRSSIGAGFEVFQKAEKRNADLIREAGEGKPTANIYPIFEDLKKELNNETDRLEEVLAGDLAAFNTEAKRVGVPPAGGS